MTKGKLTLTVDEDLVEVLPAEDEEPTIEEHMAGMTQLERLQWLARQVWQVYELWRTDETPGGSATYHQWHNGMFELVKALPEEDFGWAPEEES